MSSVATNAPALHRNAAMHQRTAAAIRNLGVCDQKIKIRRQGGTREEQGEKYAGIHGDRERRG